MTESVSTPPAPGFEALGERLDALAARHVDQRPTWLDSVLLLGSTLVPMALLAPLLWLEEEAHGRWVLGALLLQWLSIGAFALRRLRGLHRRFHQAHRSYAREMDADYAAWREVVDWLGGFPREELAARVRYVRLRRETLLYRLGLVTGGLDKLGILPLVAAAWIQFKDMKLANFGDPGSINLVGILLLALLATAYLASWWLLRLGARLDTCAALLDEAVQRHDAGPVESR